jgi:hypothetical protein
MPPSNDENVAPLSPRDLLTGELPAFLSLWERNPTPEAARALLALWAGLQRLEPGVPDPDEERLIAIVSSDTGRLAQLACQGTFFDADGWLGRATDLDRGWDEGEEEQAELEWQTQELFEQLDRAALALWAVEKLAGGGLETSQLAPVHDALGRADKFLVRDPDLFLCRATPVGKVLSAARAGLEEREPGLWQTLLRHRRVEEARDTLETPTDRTALLLSARSTPNSGDRVIRASSVRRTRRWVAWAAAAAAACIPIATLVPWIVLERREVSRLQARLSEVPSWGWIKPDAFPQDISAKDYLARIGDEANEWSSERPETTPKLAERIAEFQLGCTRLLYAEHRPLDNADRNWLREQCHRWAETIQTTRSDLEEGRIDAAKAMAEMDRNVKEIVRALRGRAQATGAG